jgi:hypothetical protein
MIHETGKTDRVRIVQEHKTCRAMISKAIREIESMAETIRAKYASDASIFHDLMSRVNVSELLALRPGCNNFDMEGVVDGKCAKFHLSCRP